MTKVFLDMTLPPAMFFLLLSVAFVFGNLFQTELKSRRPIIAGQVRGRKDITRDRELRQQRSVRSLHNNTECQDGDPLGASYSGNWNQTTSGRTCQAWSEQEPQKHTTPWVGDHNHCRINNEYGGVRCITTDPDKRWEFCDVPICVDDEQESSTIDPGCQEGNPLGASYSGNVSHTISGIPCQTWSTKVPHDHDYTEVGNESTTTAGTQMGFLEESGALPLIQRRDGNTAMSHYVPLCH